MRSLAGFSPPTLCAEGSVERQPTTTGFDGENRQRRNARRRHYHAFVMGERDRLELSDVVTGDGRALVHVFYDRFFQGAIHQANGGAWRAKLHPVDLGDYETLRRAKEAVITWFAGLDAGDHVDGPDTAVSERENVVRCPELGYAPGF